jgi:preprotein translocase subunit YajC
MIHLLLADGDAGALLGNPLVMIVPIFILFFFMILRPQRRQQQEVRKMLENLKKNDRVVTIGGIRGSVLSVNRDIDEIVIKVDDTTKLRMTVSAISRVETADGKSETAAT